MADGQAQQDGSTTQAAAAQAQSRDGAADPRPPVPGPAIGERDGLGTRFRVAPSVTREVARPFTRKPGDPLYRPLKVFTSDPSASRMEAAVALINVPYEPLEPGPEGRFFKVNSADPQQHVRYQTANLDEPYALMAAGYTPSPSEPRFHQQMVYAVCSSVYAAFRGALGRHVAWGFRRAADPSRLELRPFAFKGANAWYDKEEGALCFGYDVATVGSLGGRTLPGGYVFTCLSHDVVAHEVTHALLDGLRSQFSIPTGPDVAAFHEGFADLVAIFQRLSYRELVKTAIRKARGRLDQAPLLTDLARQLGHVLELESARRSALSKEPPDQYDALAEPHRLGRVLLCAVFEAYLTIFHRKSAPFLRLASNGTGICPPGDLPADLVDMLAHAASALAGHFQSLIIRAIDYCPPVNIELGEFLRAMITADYDLVPDDPWGYREALIDAFSRRAIYPRHVPTLAEDALLWRPPRLAMPPVAGLDVARLVFEGDTGGDATPGELTRQARALGEFATRPEHLEEFGLISVNEGEALGGRAELPQVESVRSARRAGPDGQIVCDLVAEITQRVMIHATARAPGYALVGGATVILGPKGDIRYLISKSAVGSDRVQRRRAFMESTQGQAFWRVDGAAYVQNDTLYSALHAPGSTAASGKIG
ncbi:MAG: hypothetical protein ABWY48_09035 [Pseudoxanthomonas sp.]